MAQHSLELLKAALEGYNVQIASLTEKRNELAAQLGVGGTNSNRRGRPTGVRKAGSNKPRFATNARTGQRQMSAAGRAAISAATKKRWAAYHAAKERLAS